MERNEIEALLTVADELHFGRAAARLRVSTARVSQTIRRLERRVGVPLFERTSRRVALTAVGRQLVDDIQPAYSHIKAGLARAVEAGRGVTGVLTVGFVGPVTGQVVVGAAEVFHRRHPGCRVRLVEVQIGDAADRTRRGDVDLLLCCLPAPAPDLVTGPVLVTEPRVLAVPVGHRFAREPSVPVTALAGERVLTAPCTLPLEGAGTPGEPAGTFQEVLTLIGGGRGVFPVGAHAARFHARPDVAYVPLSGAPPLRWGVVWAPANGSARVRAFTDAAVAFSRRHRDGAPVAGPRHRSAPGGR